MLKNKNKPIFLFCSYSLDIYTILFGHLNNSPPNQVSSKNVPHMLIVNGSEFSILSKHTGAPPPQLCQCCFCHSHQNHSVAEKGMYFSIGYICCILSIGFNFLLHNLDRLYICCIFSIG